MKNKTKKMNRVARKATNKKLTANKFKFSVGIFSSTYWMLDVAEKMDFMFAITNLVLGPMV